MSLAYNPNTGESCEVSDGRTPPPWFKFRHAMSDGEWEMFYSKSQTKLTEQLAEAWNIIANAGGGDWTKESKDWQRAAHNYGVRYGYRKGELIPEPEPEPSPEE